MLSLLAGNARASVTVAITGGCAGTGFVGTVAADGLVGRFESCDTGTWVVTKFMTQAGATLAEHHFDKSASIGVESFFVVDGILITPTSVATDFTEGEVVRIWSVRYHQLAPLFMAVPDALIQMGLQPDGWPFAVLHGGVMVFHVESGSSGSGSTDMPCDHKGLGCCGDKSDNCRGCCGKGCDGCTGFCHLFCQEHDDCEREGGPGPNANCFGKLARAGNALTNCRTGRHARENCRCESLNLDNNNC